MKTIKRLCIIFTAILVPLTALAQASIKEEQNTDTPYISPAPLIASNVKSKARIEFIKETSGNVKIDYPQIRDIQNKAAEEKINYAIKQAANVDSFIALGESGYGSETSILSEACILSAKAEPYIISVLISVEGRLLSGLRGHEYIPLMFLCDTGEPFEAKNIFNASAQGKIEAWIEDKLVNMSFYDVSDALPVPLDRAILTQTGVFISYSQPGFKFLSDRSAAFSFYYYELKDMLNLSENSPLLKLDALNADNADLDKENISKGRLPNVPDIIGKPIQEVLEKYKELTDPERYISSERYVLEAPEFRNIYPIVNDGKTTVNGMLAKRMSVANCKTGVTKKQDIIKSFGEPLAVLPLEGSVAEQYFVEEGEGLMYSFGEFSVMISIDKQDIFSAMLIQKEGE